MKNEFGSTVNPSYSIHAPQVHISNNLLLSKMILILPTGAKVILVVFHVLCPALNQATGLYLACDIIYSNHRSALTRFHHEATYLAAWTLYRSETSCRTVFHRIYRRANRELCTSPAVHFGFFVFAVMAVSS